VHLLALARLRRQNALPAPVAQPQPQLAPEQPRPFLLEQRQREKEALEATRRALKEATDKPKGAKRGAEAGAGAASKKAATGEEDTVPATLVDGQDIE